MLPYFPNVLLIGSNTRKTGKTTLACRLIEFHKRNDSVAAIKLALYDKERDFYMHYPEAEGTGINIIEEEHPGEKDSQQFLTSGAIKSWFIATLNRCVKQVIDIVDKMTREGYFIIIESTHLRHYIVPGVFLFLTKPGTDIKPDYKSLQVLADLSLEKGSKEFDRITDIIQIKHEQWVYC